MGDMFQLICPSDSNSSLHPDNRANNFTVTFPSPLLFKEDDWEVCLQSISMPNTYENWTNTDAVQNAVNIKVISTHVTNGSTTNVNVDAYLPPGYYSNLKEAWEAFGCDLLRARGTIIMTNLDQRGDKGFEYDEGSIPLVTAKQFPMVVPAADVVDFGGDLMLQTPTQMMITPKLAHVLKIIESRENYPQGYPYYTGSEPVPHNVLSKHFVPIQLKDGENMYAPAFDVPSNTIRYGGGGGAGIQTALLAQGLDKEPFDSSNSRFLLYSDIVESQIVGGQTTNLLATISTNDRGAAEVYYEPMNRVYYPIRKKQFQSISFEIHRRLGEFVEFKSGTTFVTLLFQRRASRR